MSLVNEINDFFIKYGEQFDTKTINYTKEVVHRIKTSNVLDNFLNKNNISASILLNEIVPYSQFKLTKYGNEKLDMDELQCLLNFIVFSNEVEKLMMEDHISITSIGEDGSLNYTPDKYAADYFQNEYNLNIEDNEEFDFSIIEEDDENDSEFIGFSLN